MMKIITTIAIILLSFSVYSQEFNLKFNSRNPKADTVDFDWYFAYELKLQIDSTIKVTLFASTERDNGIIYYSYKIKADHKYFSMMYFFDTEKDIDMYSFAYFYTWKVFKFGADFIYTDNLSPNVYLAFKHKFINFSISFTDKVDKLEFEIDPKFKIGKKIKLGYNIRGILIEEVWKWNAGLKISLFNI